MYILSIDIGKTHLAYCLTTENLTIIDWVVSNITGIETIKCSSCRNKAKYQYVVKDVTKYCCKKHCVKNELNIHKGCYKKELIEYLQKISPTNHPPIKGTKEVLLKRIQDIEPNRNMSAEKLSSQSTSHISLTDLGKGIKSEFDQRGYNSMYIDYVIIENQPEMRDVQALVTQYFVMTDHYGEIKNINPENKLKEYDFAELPNTYYNRKKISKQICAEWLLNGFVDKKWREHYAKYKKEGKQDDLADCLNQARWFCKTIL